jgi:hypothetical protein
MEDATLTINWPARALTSGAPTLQEGTTYAMPRLMFRTLAPVALAFNMLMVTSVYAWQDVATPTQERSVVQRRIPEGARNRSQPFVRTELFFGTATPDGAVTDRDFLAFLDQEVTPRFPDGLTLLKGEGQFKGADEVIVKEDSFLLILLYPVKSQKESSGRIERIRQLYKDRFQQESVLRVDDPLLVWVSF